MAPSGRRSCTCSMVGNVPRLQRIPMDSCPVEGHGGIGTSRLALARQLLQVQTVDRPTDSHGSDDDGVGAPSFVCAHCGHAIVVVHTFTRGQTIRAPPCATDPDAAPTALALNAPAMLLTARRCDQVRRPSATWAPCGAERCRFADGNLVSAVQVFDGQPRRTHPEVKARAGNPMARTPPSPDPASSGQSQVPA